MDIQEKKEKTLDILLAEDDPISEKLTSLLIKRKGWGLVTVNSGDNALRAYQTQKFDVILMDVQMPIMDGFEVTKIIREKERYTGEHIPIIALTAHAMKGDREKCLQAGMDSYIAKPIDEDELYSTIVKVWAKYENPLNINSDTPANLSRLIKLLGGNKADLLEIIEEFLSYYPSILSEIESTIEPVDFDMLERSSHKLKGSLSNFDAKKAFTIAFDMEKIGREKKQTDIRKIFNDLQIEMDILKVFLKDFK